MVGHFDLDQYSCLRKNQTVKFKKQNKSPGKPNQVAGKKRSNEASENVIKLKKQNLSPGKADQVAGIKRNNLFINYDSGDSEEENAKLPRKRRQTRSSTLQTVSRNSKDNLNFFGGFQIFILQRSTYGPSDRQIRQEQFGLFKSLCPYGMVWTLQFSTYLLS